MAGALLRSGRVKDFSPLGAVGTPVYTAAAQLRAAMRRQLDPAAADLFAVPKQDEHGDGIDWYAPDEGAVIPWTSMTPDERMGAIVALFQTREQVAARSAALEQAEDSEQQIFGKLLAVAMRIPGEKHIYLVNGQPVITFWGFTERDALPGYDVIAALYASAVAAPQSGPTAVDAEVPPLSTVTPLPEVTQRRSRRFSWWWWLLPFLLLAFVLLGLRYCRQDGASYSGLFGFAPEEPGTGAAVGPTVEEAAPGIDRDRYVLDREGRWVDRETGAVVGDREGAGGLPPSDAGPAEQGVPPSESPAAEKPPRTSPEQAAGEQPGESEEEAKPPDEPLKPESPEQAKAQEGPPPAGAASETAPPKGTPLSIPPQAAESGSTEFLNGQWRSITGLQDKSGNPVQLEYSFKDGQGTATLKRSAQSGEQTCTAPVRPSLQQGKLSIEQSSIRCPDGTVFNPSRVECAPDPTGHAICRGRYEDGNHYDVKIVKD